MASDTVVRAVTLPVAGPVGHDWPALRRPALDAKTVATLARFGLEC